MSEWLDVRRGIVMEMDEVDLPADVTEYRPVRSGDKSCSCCGRFFPLFGSGVCAECAPFDPKTCPHSRRLP